MGETLRDARATAPPMSGWLDGSLRCGHIGALMPAVMLKIYTLSNCGTCRSATKWLRARGIAFEEVPIRETPPSKAELQAALVTNGGVIRRLFNTAGRDYREQNLAEKLPTLTPAAALTLLTRNGNLVKRPFVTGGNVALAGFNEQAWSAAFEAK